MNGFREYVSLDRIRADQNVILYFEKVINQWWDDDDFEHFFNSRHGEWDYDVMGRRVRIRSKIEQLGNLLHRTHALPDVAAAISSAEANDVSFLPLEVLD